MTKYMFINVTSIFLKDRVTIFQVNLNTALTYICTLKGLLIAVIAVSTYLLQTDPFLKHFQCKLLGTKSTVLTLCKNTCASTA